MACCFILWQKNLWGRYLGIGVVVLQKDLTKNSPIQIFRMVYHEPHVGRGVGLEYKYINDYGTKPFHFHVLPGDLG